MTEQDAAKNREKAKILGKVVAKEMTHDEAVIQFEKIDQKYAATTK
jgi:hypothetical protein